MTLHAFAQSIVRDAEIIAAGGGDLLSVLPTLRQLSLEDFGLLMITMPNDEFPQLSTLLPRMAADDIQKRWTGKSGIDLFAQTAAFARQLESIFIRHTGRPLAQAKVLDFGVGYGRNLRSMLYFTDPENLFGVDAWQGSLNLSIRDNVPGTLRKSDPVPVNLPVDGNKFDLIFAFSVFTHLSKEASEASLSAMRKCISPSGVCVVTVRPVEFWSLLRHRLDEATISGMAEMHARTGYAFTPLAQSEDKTYGDASISLDFFNRNGWRIVGYDSSVVDHSQIAAVLKPTSALGE